MASDSIFPAVGTSAQRAETILELLHLNYGNGYGRSFYTRRCREILSKALDQHPGCESFEGLSATFS